MASSVDAGRFTQSFAPAGRLAELPGGERCTEIHGRGRARRCSVQREPSQLMTCAPLLFSRYRRRAWQRIACTCAAAARMSLSIGWRAKARCSTEDCLPGPTWRVRRHRLPRPLLRWRPTTWPRQRAILLRSVMRNTTFWPAEFAVIPVNSVPTLLRRPYHVESHTTVIVCAKRRRCESC